MPETQRVRSKATSKRQSAEDRLAAALKAASSDAQVKRAWDAYYRATADVVREDTRTARAIAQVGTTQDMIDFANQFAAQEARLRVAELNSPQQ